MRKRIPTAEGNVLRSFRERKGVTQEELGRLAGCSPRRIERLETGFYKAEREEVVEILSHLDVPPEAVEAALLADELGTSPGGEADRLVERAVAAGASAGAKAARAELKAELLRRQAPGHRRWAEERWSRLKRRTGSEQDVLRRARPQIDAKSDPRLLFAHDFNKAVNLALLDRFDEAELLLPLIEAVTNPANELDTVRLRWLQGRIRAGLGRTPEALAALAEVRAYFRSEGIAYDFAVVSVELGTIYLEQGRAGLVRELADQMRWIFESQGIHKHALEALALFCHAVRMEEAQADWTRRLVKYLNRAQNNPALLFEP